MLKFPKKTVLKTFNPVVDKGLDVIVEPTKVNGAVEFPIVIAPEPPVPILIVPVLIVLHAPIAMLPVNPAPFAIVIPPPVKLAPTVITVVTAVAFNVVTVVVPFSVVVPILACPKVTFPLPVDPIKTVP